MGVSKKRALDIDSDRYTPETLFPETSRQRVQYEHLAPGGRYRGKLSFRKWGQSCLFPYPNPVQI